MTQGEIAFLALAIGCFALFATAVSLLRREYVQHRAAR